MKRIVSLITACALAIHASGLALAATVPPPSLGEARRGLGSAAETKSYDYDDANRLIEVDYATGSMTNVTFDYDDADRMIEMVDGTGTSEWFYDLDGQVNKMISPQGTIEYTYYATTGRLHELIEKIPGGSDIVTTYTYDDNGRTETIDKFGETTTFEYDEASRPEKMIYDTGAYALYTYDGRSRIKAVEHKNSSHALLRKETNAYDPASRITSRYEGPASGGVTTTFGYDDVGQLLTESASGYSATYTYDANGNRTNRTVNGVSETYTVDDADKLTSVTWSQGGNNYAKEYAYHWSGRPTSIVLKTNGTPTTTRTFTWDKESRITALTDGTTSASYVYNGFTARTSKTVGGTTTTYKRAGASAVSPVVADAVGGTTTNHLPGISSRTGGTSTFSHSGIKNGVLQTNSSQTNTGTKRYDAFGNMLATTGSWVTPFSYGAPFGYQSDSEFGYQLLGHRYYDSSTGRFLTRDPIKDGRNWYSYCANDPVSYFDWSGWMRIRLPSNPAGLGPGWTRLPHGGGTGAERWLAPGGSEGLEFHPGKKGAPGHGGSDHWHKLKRDKNGKLKKEDKHHKPGEEIEVNFRRAIGPKPAPESMWNHVNWRKVLIYTAVAAVGVAVVVGSGGTAAGAVAAGTRLIPVLAGG